jgi:hypothetical protein
VVVEAVALSAYFIRELIQIMEVWLLTAAEAELEVPVLLSPEQLHLEYPEEMVKADLQDK